MPPPPNVAPNVPARSTAPTPFAHNNTPTLAARDLPANNSNAYRFFSGLEAGYCEEPGRKNDVTGAIKMCECLKESLFRGPDDRFIDSFKDEAATYLSAYLYGDKGDSTNVTYGIQQFVPAAKAAGEDGNIRGLAQFEYNSLGKECNRTEGDNFKMSMSELRNAISAGLGSGVGEEKW